MIPSPEIRRRRGAYYRAQVLILERRFQEARALLDELARDGGYDNFAPGTIEMQLQLRFQYVHARALIATGDTSRGRAMIIDLDQQLEHDANEPLVSGAFRTRLVNDIGLQLSAIGSHQRALTIADSFLVGAPNPRRRADALCQLALRRIAFGFERECFAQLAPTDEERHARLTIARSLYRYAEGAAEEAITLRTELAAADPSYGPQLLYARAERSNARLRNASVSVLLSEADAEHRLLEIENDAWVIAQDSRTRGMLERERVWRFGQVGACRAARAAIIADRDPSTSRALALRARDFLRYSHKTRNSDGSLPSPQASMNYGELLVLLGEVNEAHRVFLEAAEHLRNRYGAKHACTRLFFKRVADIGA